MFRNPDDSAIVETYTQEIARQLSDQKSLLHLNLLELWLSYRNSISLNFCIAFKQLPYLYFYLAAVNFLYADGKKFAHPLHHLGKSEKDLPILAIDSFRHMYVFPDVKELT